MNTLQLVALIVVSITLAVTSTSVIIMSVAWARAPCPECPGNSV